LLDLAANIPAGHGRQPEIEHDCGRGYGAISLQRRLPIRADLDRKSFRFKQTLERLLDRAVILNH
jgi:hypothetical protein